MQQEQQQQRAIKSKKATEKLNWQNTEFQYWARSLIWIVLCLNILQNTNSSDQRKASTADFLLARVITKRALM